MDAPCQGRLEQLLQPCGTCCQSFTLALRPLKAKKVVMGSGGKASTYVCYFFKRKSSGSDAVGNICTGAEWRELDALQLV